MSTQIRIVSCLLFLLLIVPYTSHAQWAARHGMTSSAYQAAFDDLVGQGYRLTHVSGYSVDGQARFAAIWEIKSGPAWAARHNMSASDYQSAFDEFAGQGYRLLDVSGYNVGGEDRYAAIWEQSSGPVWQARHRMTASGYQAAFDELTGQGYRLVDVSGYSLNGEERYAAIWVQQSGLAWQARHGLTASAYQAAFDDLVGQGYRLIHVSGYEVNGEDRYAAIWEQSSVPAWSARHGQSSSAYQATFNELAGQGYKLDVVSGYGIGSTDLYASIWSTDDPPPPVEDLPMSGEFVPELAAFDDAMQDYMKTRSIKAGALAVMRNGELLYERGFGWLDEAMTIELPPDALFRLASVVKPVTAAAIKKLIAEGSISASDHVFCLSRTSGCILDTVPAGTPDPNAENITVQHLLDHRGGWDRDVSGDPMFSAIPIANEMGISSPPSQEQLAEYMLGRPLDFAPGAQYAYSNFGYLLLGLIVEDVTGISYTDYIQQHIFVPNGVAATEVELGRSLPAFRNPREPWYSDPGSTNNVFNPTELVPWPDGGFHVEAFEAHGGLIASSAAIAQFLKAYWIDGDPRSGNGQTGTFFGSMPGTTTMARQRPDGVNIVALFNQRADASGLDYFLIDDQLDAVADGITDWPENSSTATEPDPKFGDSFQLRGNYPEPFQASTTIEFSLEHSGHVSLKVFNLLGQELETLVEETLAVGNHTATWHAAGRPSGVYTYVLETEAGVESRVMVVLK